MVFKVFPTFHPLFENTQYSSPMMKKFHPLFLLSVVKSDSRFRKQGFGIK